MPRRLKVLLASATLLASIISVLAVAPSAQRVAADVGGVYSNVPTFGPGQPMTITVSSEDDDGDLVIISNLPSSALTVTNCQGVGTNQLAGKCDGTGMSSVDGQGSTYVVIDTESLDDDQMVEQFTVTLTLTASCTQPTAVTIAANQPGNAGPDDVTVNCVPATPTNTPTATPTITPTSTATATPPPSTATPTLTPTPGTPNLSISINPPNLPCDGAGLVTASVKQDGSPAPDGTLVVFNTSHGTLVPSGGTTSGGQVTTLLRTGVLNTTLIGNISASSGGMQATGSFSAVACTVSTESQPPIIIRPPSTGSGGLASNQ